MELLRFGFLKLGIIDIIDISIVGYFFYQFLLLVKGTRAVQILTGLFLLFLISFSAYWFNLEGLKWLITNIATVGIIVMVILFQPEIRSALAQIGHSKLIRKLYRFEEQKTLDEIVKGALRLSELRYGALIVLEKSVGLKNFILTGKSLNAEVSSEFLVTLFTPYTPLHDGAVVVRGDTVVAAACTLPLTSQPEYRHLYGMRHKAAIGITEESDAVSVCVSEENGKVSLAYGGRLQTAVEPDQLKESLLNLLKI
ncbi:MAG: hypothetical protein AMJ90_04720 [candidate division Zixibacteria bacterium SM23_73_2]|nr:MAG: hypothetical protein AMJ90_04720 [candidate division Zixibacteria bacterium SM23_73_2]